MDQTQEYTNGRDFNQLSERKRRLKSNNKMMNWQKNRF